MISTKLEHMNLLDKFLFDEAMEDKEAYEAAVSILLENEVELLGRTETEKELRISPELRQVRLDVIGMDDKGTVYYTDYSNFRFIPINLSKDHFHATSIQVCRNNYSNNLVQAGQ